MKQVLAIAGIAVLMTSVAAAEVSQSKINVRDGITPTGTETPGTLGSLTISGTQVGPLQFQINASVTTQGGDGVPRTFVTIGGSTIVLNDVVWLYAQIYDSPWAGGCTFWQTPGPNWCDWGVTTVQNATGASLHVSFTTTVPAADDYQTYAAAAVGATWNGGVFNPPPYAGWQWGFRDSSVSTGPLGPYYIGSTQVPTPTPGVGGGGEPVPTLNWLGILAMVAILGGVAVLMMTRK
jgi:opacity protein-like surface antigen